MRAGPGWERTLLAVVYDDTGGWYDQVVPPHEGVPNDEAPCNVNVSSKCQGESGNKQNDEFDFKRLGLRAPALLISPWVPKGGVAQEPRCSARDHVNGSCPSQRRGSSTAQFEHSSLPATVRNLFNLSSFLTKRDAWAGDFSELLLDAPRTDAPMHLPDALAPAMPWCSQLTTETTCAKNEGCTWNDVSHICKEGPLPNASSLNESQRRRLSDQPQPQHCSARTAACQAEGEVTARQRNRMSTLQAVTGVAAPDAETLDASAANAWLAARWNQYMANTAAPKTDDESRPCGGGRALMFAYWTPAQWQGLHLAWSCDGRNFTALNNNMPVMNVSCGTMRDVFVHRGPDGRTFHLLSTGACCSNGFNYLNTTDFVRFEYEQKCWMSVPNTTAVWAPEWTWSEERQEFLVFWSSETDGQAAEGPKGDHLRIWGAWSTDFRAPATPPTIVFDPGFTVIDADIVRVPKNGGGVEFNMFFKDERGHNLAASDGCAVGAANASARTACPGWKPAYDKDNGALCLAAGCCFQPHPNPDPAHFPWCYANSTVPPMAQEKVVRRATSTSASGGWSSISEPISPEFSEGPEAVHWPTADGRDPWLLYYVTW